MDNRHYPFEHSIYAQLNLAYLQYFADGNKQTARLMQTAILVHAGIAPLILTSKDIVNYLDSVVHFYETGDARPYAELFVGIPAHHRYLFRTNAGTTRITTSCQRKYQTERQTLQEIKPRHNLYSISFVQQAPPFGFRKFPQSSPTQCGETA